MSWREYAPELVVVRGNDVEDDLMGDKVQVELLDKDIGDRVISDIFKLSMMDTDTFGSYAMLVCY